jgi:WhiB family transcriptional regulator, redox-sensing transcriptional regulator
VPTSLVYVGDPDIRPSSDAAPQSSPHPRALTGSGELRKGSAITINQTLPTRKPARRRSRAVEPSDDVVTRLPPPTTEGWEWQLRAACRGMDSALFFPADKEKVRARATRIARAKTICAHCPAINECRDYALNSGELFGIWGGLSEEERSSASGLASSTA